MNSNSSSHNGMGDAWVGVDIGGANLKAAHTAGWCKSVSFPMWKKWKSLGISLADLLQDCPPIHGIAVTMTGELADCFATRAEGVAVILEQITSIVPASMVRVYDVHGQWRTVSQSAREPWSVAASNWHGLARFASRFTEGRSSLLIDMGSTTTDIIPVNNNRVMMDATTDSQRLQCGALVYTGVERSNVAGIVRELTLFGSPCPIMNEQFATMRDVYLWLREIDDLPNDCETADNQPATRHAARYRLARVVGEDGATLTDSDVDKIASEIFTAQTSMIAKAIGQVSQLHSATVVKKSKKPVRKTQEGVTPFDCVVLSGHGDYVIEAALALIGWDGIRFRLADHLGPELSRCAPAFAIATLAASEVDLA